MSDAQKIIGLIEEAPTIKNALKPDGVTPYVRIGFKIAGKRMSVFDNILPNYESFKMGDRVEASYTVNGQFNNMKTMTKLANEDNLPPEAYNQPAPVTAQAPVPVPASTMPTAAPKKTSIYMDEKKETNASIVTQVILKCASDMVCAGKIEPGNIKMNAAVLAEIYKETKKTILE